MTKQEICRIVGGILVVLIGIAVGYGGLQLWNGAPSSWKDVIANRSTVKNAARGIVVVALMLLVGGIGAIINSSWGQMAASIGILNFIVGGFWANYILFGNIRPKHTGANVVVGAIILFLLWFGYAQP